MVSEHMRAAISYASTAMGIQDIIALTVVAGAVAYIVRSLWRTMKQQAGCGCDQGKKGSTVRGAKRTPIITADQIGRPPAEPGRDPSHKP